MPKIKKHPKFSGVYLLKGLRQRIYTLNLDKDNSVYGETLVNQKDLQYREWNPYRSKLAALIMNNVRNIYLENDSKCLYLGASSGTTVSHISDIVTNGVIYAVEFAPRSLRELLQHCENRKNIIPILEDASKPENYAYLLNSLVDWVYCDVAQPNMTEIAIKNCKMFLKPGGILIIAIKARSINVSINPNEIFNQELKKLENNHFEILEKVDIKPYTQDHLMIIARFLED